MNCLPASELETMARCLVRGARLELFLTPKPGLVDQADSGSHPNLSFATMERSIGFVSDALDELVLSLTAGEPLACQQRIGVRVERRMQEELGTNTHKGFLFLSGILLIARRHAVSGDEPVLRASLADRAREFFQTTAEQMTHGALARKKYQSGGIVLEAMKGFPSIFEEGLPVFRTATQRHVGFKTASFAMLARLMQTVEDTTTLHRAGSDGLARVKRDGMHLERLIGEGEDPLPRLHQLNRDYVRMNITMGGIADLLGIAFGHLLAGGEIPREDEECLLKRPDDRGCPQHEPTDSHGHD